MTFETCAASPNLFARGPLGRRPTERPKHERHLKRMERPWSPAPPQASARSAQRPRSPLAAARAGNALVSGPILPALLRLTIPNLTAMLATALGGDLRDRLRGHPRNHILGGHRAGISDDHADADAVGGSDGRRRLVCDQPGARRRRPGARRGACPARRRHRRGGRPFFQRDLRSIRRSDLSLARRLRSGAQRSAGLRQHRTRRRDPHLAAQHPRLDRARHRQHAGAFAHATRRVGTADCARWRLGPRHRTDPALWPCGRRNRPDRRLRAGRAVSLLVPPLRARALEAHIRRCRSPARDVF